MSEGWQYLLPPDYCKTEAVISRLQPSPRSKFATHKNNGGEDMTTIYKAIPNQSEVTISCLDERLRFIGNDVKKLTIDNVEYGRSIILEEIDSLEEITVRKPGAIFAFNSFPTKTIRISGISRILMKTLATSLLRKEMAIPPFKRGRWPFSF